MNKQVKERLRMVVAKEDLTNADIAFKTGYSSVQVSRSISPKNDAISNKFLNKFFEAYPRIKAEYKSFILEGGQLPGMVQSSEQNLFTGTAQLEELKAKNNYLEKALEDLKVEMAFYKRLLEKAMSLHPELEKQLNLPSANKSLGLGNVPVGMLSNSLGANQGAFA